MSVEILYIMSSDKSKRYNVYKAYIMGKM